jgi:HEAT repeat protein
MGPEVKEVAVRRRAAVLAGYRGDEKAARSALSDLDAGVRSCGLSALARLNALRPADMRAAFSDPVASLRRRACEVAARSSPSAETAIELSKLLGDPDASVVGAACYALGEVLDGTGAHGPVVNEERWRCAQTLGRTAREHGDALCREAAVAALGSIGDPDSLPAVLAALTDKPAVRRRAVVALAAFEGPDVNAALERALGDRDWQVRQVAQDLLERRPRGRP